MNLAEEEFPMLPEDTMKLVNEFLEEREARENGEYNSIVTKSGRNAKFEEDWQLSQFWYNAPTKQAFQGIIADLVIGEPPDFQIALLSCPSLYSPIKEHWDNVKIFEFDQRFSAFGEDYVFYNINEADKPGYMDNYVACYDLIVADPPFLSEDCIAKMAKIIKKLKKPDANIIFCSGEAVESWVAEHLCLTKCKFQPEHERNLGNKFASYANFNLDDYVHSD